MAKFTFEKTPLCDAYVITPTIFGDSRGYFSETYNKQEFHDNGITVDFVQDNESRSCRGVLRGLHFQKKNPQGKLVRCTEGEVYDVAVDMRKSSATFGKWYGVTLSAENKKMFYIPEGFAHGFFVKSESATFSYKCTRLYCPDDEGGIAWDDKTVGVDWQIPEGTRVILSDKDRLLPAFDRLDFFFD